MKKIVPITIILIFMEISAFSSDSGEILRQYYRDPLVVKRVYESIKAVLFKEINHFNDFSLQDETFTLISEKGRRMAVFRSRRFKGLYEKLSDRKLFLELLRDAKAYGIDTGIKSLKTGDGSIQNFQSHEARVLILTHGEGLDEEFLVFLADK
jgi:hypothetical protein